LHTAQASARRPPQALQNFASDGLSRVQAAQIIAVLSTADQVRITTDS
jgi:hypothetical protein